MADRTPETYKQALGDLDLLLRDLEADDIDVDGLEAKVESAAVLLKFCKARLDATELKVKTIIASLDDDSGEPSASGAEIQAGVIPQEGSDA